MDGNSFHMKHRQSVPGKHRYQRGERKVIDVFVIDGIELSPLDQINGVRELQDEPPTGLQNFAKTGDEIVNLRHVGKDIVAKNQICLATFIGKFFRKLSVKELGYRLDPLRVGHLCDVGRRFNSKARNASLLKVL